MSRKYCVSLRSGRPSVIVVSVLTGLAAVLHPIVALLVVALFTETLFYAIDIHRSLPDIGTLLLTFHTSRDMIHVEFRQEKKACAQNSTSFRALSI